MFSLKEHFLFVLISQKDTRWHLSLKFRMPLKMFSKITVMKKTNKQKTNFEIANLQQKFYSKKIS